MSLTSAQLDQVAAKMLVMQPASKAKLPKPVTNVGATTQLGKDLKAIIDRTDAPFGNYGIGVVDFTKDATAPLVWLHNEGDSWRVGSTGKLAILLSAVQLRDDVRAIEDLGLLKKPEEYDALFAQPELWRLCNVYRAYDIADPASAPRISTIFDFTRKPVDFAGLKQGTTAFNNKVDIQVTVNGKQTALELEWSNISGYDFSERLWLAGKHSDNVAATACMSEIGVAYMRTVQRAYGLRDTANGLYLMVNGQYRNMEKDIKVSSTGTAVYRMLTRPEMTTVKDAMLNQTSRRYDDQSSWQPGSAASLAAYLIALRQNRLVSFRDAKPGDAISLDACGNIRGNLKGSTGFGSFITNAVTAKAVVTDEFSKIGLLNPIDGEPSPFVTEFVYLETKDRDARAPTVMKFGIVVTGIRVVDAKAFPEPAATYAAQLGVAIYDALVAHQRAATAPPPPHP